MLGGRGVGRRRGVGGMGAAGWASRRRLLLIVEAAAAGAGNGVGLMAVVAVVVARGKWGFE